MRGWKTKTDPRQLYPNDYVKHFKRETVNIKERPEAYMYQILYFAQDTETLEDVVVYRSVETNKVWVRPLKMFMSEVDKAKYPNIKQRYRFEKATAEDALWAVACGETRVFSVR